MIAAGIRFFVRINDQRDCATCVNLCPTGAITRSIENDRLSHHFSSALCINCRLAGSNAAAEQHNVVYSRA